jgi:hypothetical protein
MKQPIPPPTAGFAPRARGRGLLVVCFGLACVAILLPGAASALTIGVDFTSSSYQVAPGDTYASLLAQHQAGASLGSATGVPLGNVTTGAYAGGVNSNYSLMMTVDLSVAQAGLYTFQVGADWGRGGVAAVIANGSGAVLSEYLRTDNIWWNNDWNDPDVFTTQLNLNQGQSYTLAWIGFEDCCAGATTIRFSYNGGAFQTIDQTTLAPYAIPEPGTGWLVLTGLVGLGLRARSTNRRQRATLRSNCTL